MGLPPSRMIVLADNLIKGLQIKAATGSERLSEEAGFKGAVAVVLENRTRFRGLQTRSKLLKREMEFMGERILERVVRQGPERTEPRATKKRTKCYNT